METPQKFPRVAPRQEGCWKLLEACYDPSVVLLGRQCLPLGKKIPSCSISKGLWVGRRSAQTRSSTDSTAAQTSPRRWVESVRPVGSRRPASHRGPAAPLQVSTCFLRWGKPRGGGPPAAGSRWWVDGHFKPADTSPHRQHSPQPTPEQDPRPQAHPVAPHRTAQKAESKGATLNMPSKGQLTSHSLNLREGWHFFQ